MAETRRARFIIDGLREEVGDLSSFSGGKPEATPTEVRNYVVELIEVVDRLDERLKAMEDRQ
jgi:hypothetical protein